MPRTPSVRVRVVVGLVVSVAVHAAALALVSIEIPSPSTVSITLVRPAALPAPVEPPEPAIQVIEIRPPGMYLPSGGGGAASEEAPRLVSVDPGASPATAVSLTTVTPAPRQTMARGVSTVSLAPEAPVATELDVVLAASRADMSEVEEDNAGVRTTRPGRGVVLRGTGSDGGSGARSGASGSTGRGLGLGKGGVTIVGPGGDCITPGATLPSPGRIPSERPQMGSVNRRSPGGIGRIGTGSRPR